MKKIISLIFAMLFSSSAFAVIESVAPITNPNYNGYSTLALLAASLAAPSQGITYACTASGETAGSPISCTSGQSSFVYHFTVWSSAVCPTATPAYTYNSAVNMCQRGTACTAGIVTGFSLPATSSPAVMCSGGCETNVVSASDQYMIGGVQSIVGTSITTGATCSGGNTANMGTGSGATPYTPPPVPPALTPPPAAPAPVAPYTGPTTGAGGGSSTSTTNNTTINNSTGSTSTSSTTTTNNTTVDFSPVVGAVNGTTAAVNAVADTVNKTSISAFCAANPTAVSCQRVDLLKSQGFLSDIRDALGFGKSVDSASADAALGSASSDYSTAIDGAVTAAGAAESTDEALMSNAFILNIQAGACTPWSGTVRGASFSVNTCAYTEKLRELLGWLFAVWGAFSVWETFFRKTV